jgi:hypothetical protein
MGCMPSRIHPLTFSTGLCPFANIFYLTPRVNHDPNIVRGEADRSLVEVIRNGIIRPNPNSHLLNQRGMPHLFLILVGRKP